MAMAEPTEYTETGVDTHSKLILPDSDDFPELAVFRSNVASINRFGAKTLAKRVGNYMLHRRLSDENWEAIQAGVTLLNGERTAGQRAGYKKKSARELSEAFYATLSGAALRQHCSLYGLDYDGFESSADVITALVDRHVAMGSGWLS